ncbi:hypothetical protein BV20DRAFT_1018382 [Pilatotrama ljubarskyi]|nr:hypothetical protein BV20DRAFT_1018382 [Pilatotrama ljubarskyi]
MFNYSVFAVAESWGRTRKRLGLVLRFAHPLAIAVVLLMGFANLAIDFVLVGHAKQLALSRTPPLTEYSFIAEDYPPGLPLVSARKSVGLSLEESVRYDPSHPESPLEWVYAGAVGDGNIRLGVNHRFFNTGFSYQLHCLRVIVTTLQKDDPPARAREREHVSRCLNVMRRSALCSADTTLEPAHSLERNFTLEHVAGEHRCTDWRALYETIKQNWVEWREFQESPDA